MVQVRVVTVAAFLPTPTVLLTVSQLGQRLFAVMTTGLMAPRTVVSTRLVYCVVHLSQAMSGAAATAVDAAGWGIHECAAMNLAAGVAGEPNEDADGQTQ